MSKAVYILRGISGSSKSTFAKTIRDAFIVSADDFFIKNGVYSFNKVLLGKAHSDCFTKFKQAIDACISPIVVDNTNIKNKDYKDYIRYAREHEYEIRIVEFACPNEFVARLFARRNIHNVSRYDVLRMYYNFQQATEKVWKRVKPHYALTDSVLSMILIALLSGICGSIILTLLSSSSKITLLISSLISIITFLFLYAPYHMQITEMLFDEDDE